jgi:hypothetical protein
MKVQVLFSPWGKCRDTSIIRNCNVTDSFTTFPVHPLYRSLRVPQSRSIKLKHYKQNHFRYVTLPPSLTEIPLSRMTSHLAAMFGPYNLQSIPFLVIVCFLKLILKRCFNSNVALSRSFFLTLFFSSFIWSWTLA